MGKQQTGGEEAAARFYRLVWPQRAAILRLARVLARDDSEANELAQETMVKAFRAIDSFRDGTEVRAWLAAILRNVRTDSLRAAAVRSAVSLDELAAEPPDQRVAVEETHWHEPEAILQAFSDQQVIDALRALPEEIRWTLLLVDVEGMEHVDAAVVLGVPIGTIKSRAHRGRAMLREVLTPLAQERRLLRH